jgi:hypothetical protein
MRFSTGTVYAFRSPSRITGLGARNAPRRSERRRWGVRRGEAHQSSPLCGSTREFCPHLLAEPPHGLGAPQARPPKRSGAMGPRERRRGGSAGAKPPGSSPLCGSKPEFCPHLLAERHNGLGAPQARPPKRSGAMGPRERRRGGAAGAKPLGSSPLCGSTREFCPHLLAEPPHGLGAPQARPPKRSGAMGPRERRRGGSAGAKPPGSS